MNPATHSTHHGDVAAVDLVFGAGDLVRAWGRFVRAGDGDWLDVAQVDDLLLHADDWHSHRSFRIVCADPTAVPTETDESTAAGSIGITGVWHDDLVEVVTQTSDRPPREPGGPWWEVRPCPPPPGGWPCGRTDEELGFDLEALFSSGVVVTAVPFRPSPDQVVLVVAASDVAAAAAPLAVQLPGRFCVVASRYSKELVDDVAATLRANARSWQLEVWSGGPRVDDEGQPYLRVSLFRVSAAMAAWADTLPDGVLRLRPAITPAGRERST